MLRNKYLVPRVNTAEELSFELLHNRITSKDPNFSPRVKDLTAKKKSKDITWFLKDVQISLICVLFVDILGSTFIMSTI